MAEDEKFLDRWSRRKVESKTADAAAEDAATENAAQPELLEDGAPAGQEVAALGPDADEATEPESEEIPPEIADIDIDTLDYESDFTVFMKDNVPEIIRRRALRQLWRSNPVLANVDGLNDYDEDFTDAALVVKGLKSAYQIGKGYILDEEDETDADGTEPVAEDEATVADAAESDPDVGEADDPDEHQAAGAEDSEEPEEVHAEGPGRESVDAPEEEV